MTGSQDTKSTEPRLVTLHGPSYFGTAVKVAPLVREGVLTAREGAALVDWRFHLAWREEINRHEREFQGG